MKTRFTLLALVISSALAAQSWNGKNAAVVLTYDDAIDIDLSTVVPAPDSFGFRGTFYMIGNSPVIAKRMEEWRRAAKEGHELGNHALFHPCDGSKPDRTWVRPDFDLSKYTVSRAVAEIKLNNTLLKAIDGKEKRTFAYPCGDLKIGNVFFYDSLKTEFAGARGTTPGLETASGANLADFHCYSINGQKADYMINLVKEAISQHKLLVFLFHGVGGGHSINVDQGEHTKLLKYIKANEKDLWVSTMVDVADKIKTGTIK